MDGLSFRVYGQPASKGSVTRMPNGAYLPAGTAASRMNFHNWKGNIAAAAIVEMHGRKPWEGAVRILAEFALPVPKALPKKKLGWLPHVKRPDLDKLTRALFDPLKGIVWVDDSQVCFASINKVYAWTGHTGCMVVIDFLDDEWMDRYGAAHRNVSNLMDGVSQ